jgi:hypothetical protein
VVDGALAANGMVSFKTALTRDEVDSIRAYVVSRAIDAKKNGTGGSFSAARAARTGGRAQCSVATGVGARVASVKRHGTARSLALIDAANDESLDTNTWYR